MSCLDAAATGPTFPRHGPLWQRLAAPVVSNPRSRAEWQERRRVIRDAIRNSLGLASAPERLPLAPRSEPVPGAAGELLDRIAFQCWPGARATGWLARPPGDGSRPALLV